MKEKIRKIKESVSNAPHKKKTIVAIVIALLLVGGGTAGGYIYMSHSDSGKANVASEKDDKELTAEEKEKAAEEELKKAKESGDEEAIKEAEKEVEKAKEQVNASNNNSSKGSSGSSSSSSNASNKGSYTKPSSGSSSGGSSSSGSSGGSVTKPSKPSKPAHQHNWQPVYREYTTQIIDPNNPSYIACNDCGANLGKNGEYEWDHLDKYPTHTHGTSREYNYITQTEKEIVGYKCSCGATK